MQFNTFVLSIMCTVASAAVVPGQKFHLKVMHSGTQIHQSSLTMNNGDSSVVIGGQNMMEGVWQPNGEIKVGNQFLHISDNGRLELSSKGTVFGASTHHLTYEGKERFVARPGMYPFYEPFYSPNVQTNGDIGFVIRIQPLDNSKTTTQTTARPTATTNHGTRQTHTRTQTHTRVNGTISGPFRNTTTTLPQVNGAETANVALIASTLAGVAAVAFFL